MAGVVKAAASCRTPKKRTEGTPLVTTSCGAIAADTLERILGIARAALGMTDLEELLATEKRQPFEAQGKQAAALQRVLTFSGRTPKMNPRFAKSAKGGAPRHV
jgi:hypothetical protein